jgi:hypothetical protein
MNILKNILGTTCQFFMIIELTDSKREQVVSAESLTEADSIAKDDLLYRFYLIEPYELEFPIVEKSNNQAANSDLPHTLRNQAV